jgi:uncharacterized protein YqfA (UPF0365 family)
MEKSDVALIMSNLYGVGGLILLGVFISFWISIIWLGIMALTWFIIAFVQTYREIRFKRFMDDLVIRHLLQALKNGKQKTNKNRV